MRIVLGVDGSEPSRVAVRLLSGAAWPRPLEVTLVAAYERPIDWTGTMPLIFNEDDERLLRDELRTSLVDLAVPLRQLGAAIDVEVRAGRPADTLIDVAREREADLLVVGNRGRGATRSALLGSVSAHLVDHAPCPVLVARGASVNRMLFATDGSETSIQAATILERWRAFRGLPVDVVSVAPSARARSDEGAGRDHGAHADQMAMRLSSAGYRCTARVRTGDAAGEICAAAVELGDDLIVTGSRGLGDLRRVLSGSVAHDVLLHATASVLVMRGAVRQRATVRHPLTAAATG